MTNTVENSGLSPSVSQGEESVSLYFKSGSSDKVYHARIDAAQGGAFTVSYAYGRRGGTLSTGTKTKAPVDYATARRIFDKLVADKQSKGYTAGADGTPYRHSVDAGRVSGLLPQLLNTIDTADARSLVSDPHWVMQEKFDGRRLMLRKTGDHVEGINKLGLVVSMAASLDAAARLLPGDFVLDGEAVGDRFHAFDLLSLDGTDLRARPYGERYQALRSIVGDGDAAAAIGVAPCWVDSGDKAHQLDMARARNAEGVVFKRWDAPYRQGRPNSGGTQRKLKFVATASVVVRAINEQRSVRVGLLNDTTWVDAGAVTVPANQDVPQIGEVVEIRYLYATPGSGVLYQPVLLGVRTDVEPCECVVAQLKFKAE